jgi:hypothetical protein
MVMGRRDADYYQAHKDDPEEWGEPQRAPRSRSRRLAAMISVRFTPDEEQVVRQAALDTGQSVSHFIRQATLKEAGSRGPSAETMSLSALSSTSTTSSGGTRETRRGNTLVQVFEPSSVPEGVHVA